MNGKLKCSFAVFLVLGFTPLVSPAELSVRADIHITTHIKEHLYLIDSGGDIKESVDLTNRGTTPVTAISVPANEYSHFEIFADGTILRCRFEKNFRIRGGNYSLHQQVLNEQQNIILKNAEDRWVASATC